MNVYISGAITGREPKDYKGRFGRAAEIVRDTGNNAINPAEWESGHTWDEYMNKAKSIIESGVVDMIYMLDGWEKSRGASRERFWAMAKGISVLYQNPEDKKKFKEM